MRDTLAVGAAVAVVLGACGTPDETAPPTTPSQAVSAPPIASPSSDAGPLSRDPIWRVVVTELVVRTEPGVFDSATMLPARLTVDDRVLIVAGPVVADGYEWVQVLPIRPDALRERPFGWVAAASRDGEPWLEREDLACPDPEDETAALLALAPEERLACYGGQSIVIRAPAGGCGAGGGFPVSYEPSWLMGESGCGLGVEPGQIALMLRTPPGASYVLDQGPQLVVRGHFDDPAAATCVARANYPGVTPPSQTEAVALCRTQFVVEAVARAP